MLPSLIIRGRKIKVPIIQGGMGVGVSLAPLASSVANEGGVGIISSACIDEVESKQTGEPFNTRGAVVKEITDAKRDLKEDGVIGINIMVRLLNDYEWAVMGAVDAEADMIISGAGLPLRLPEFVGSADIALVPIVSSVRALDVICRKWKNNYMRIPDAVVLEGPLAGGHLGFKYNQIDDEKHSLKNLFPPVKEYAQKNGNFPVIVAGGIYNYEDITYWILLQGADGVQMGTRFLGTKESSAASSFKNAVVGCKKEDIIIIDPIFNPPGSSCGLPMRALRQSPCLNIPRKPRCNKGYVCIKGKCPAQKNCEEYVCLCNVLISAAGWGEKGENPLWTVGSNAFRVNSIISVHELMEELKGNKKNLG
jgi:nitronate monooxygenase